MAAVEKNLRTAIELYLEDIEEFPETIVSHVSTEEFIEFLRDTEPEWYREPAEGLLLRPLEVHEVRPLLCLRFPRCPALLEKGGAVFVRQGKTDHAVYSRYGRRE